MKILDIIGIIIEIDLIYYTYKTELSNLKNGYSLVTNKKTSEKIRSFLYIMAILYVSRKIQIILLTVLFIFALGLYKYIEHQNKIVNKDNAILQAFYIQEIKKQISYVCIGALIYYVIIIIYFLC